MSLPPPTHLPCTAWQNCLVVLAKYRCSICSKSHFDTLTSGSKCQTPSITSINVQTSIQQWSSWQQILSEEVWAQAAHLILPCSSFSGLWLAPLHFSSQRSLCHFLNQRAFSSKAILLIKYRSDCRISASVSNVPVPADHSAGAVVHITSHHEAPRSSQLQGMWVGGRLWTSIPSCITVPSWANSCQETVLRLPYPGNYHVLVISVLSTEVTNRTASKLWCSQSGL